jgi:DHA2 family multidrug resistance protein
MALRLHLGVRASRVADRSTHDVYGLVSGGVGMALIYAALDQGNRLDWLNSGLICALLLAGGVLVIAFFVAELRTPHPVINLRVAFAPPLPTLLVLLAFVRLVVLSTAYLIPLYLGSVRGFRALDVGQSMIWIAAPQLILCPLAALMLRRSEPRLVASIGFIFVAIACLSVAHELTPIWGSDQFLPSQLLQAVGQSFALSGVVFFAVLHLRPEDAITFGASLQVARLMGGELGTAFVVTFARIRGQVASNLIGLHLASGDTQLSQRLHAYAAATANAGDPASALARSAIILAGVVRRMATTQAVIDCFVTIGGCTAFALLLLVIQRPAPSGPASPVSWLSWRASKPP